MREYSVIDDRVLFMKRVPDQVNGLFLRPNESEYLLGDNVAQGEVIAVGPGTRLKDGTFSPLPVKPGDKILYEVRFAVKFNAKAKGVDEDRWLRYTNRAGVLAIIDDYI